MKLPTPKKKTMLVLGALVGGYVLLIIFGNVVDGIRGANAKSQSPQAHSAPVSKISARTPEKPKPKPKPKPKAARTQAKPRPNKPKASQARAAKHAFVRRYLVRCLRAIDGLYVADASHESHLQLVRMDEVASAVYDKCGGDDSQRVVDLFFKNTRDPGMEAAYHAANALGVGTGYYQQYLMNLMSDISVYTLLPDARREIAEGQKEARQALAKL
jgi:hypothetical protein